MSENIYKTTRIEAAPFQEDAQFSSPDCPRLILKSGDQRGKVIDIDKPSIKIGKNKNLEVSLEYEGMGEEHFEIIQENKKVRVRDLHSCTGTFINNVRIDQAVLVDKDELRAGEAVFVYQSQSDRDLLVHEGLYDRARYNGVTDAYHRMYLLKTLEQWRQTKPFSIISLGIDQSEQIDEPQAEGVKKLILKEIFHKIHQCTRQKDFCARFGEKDFIILMERDKIVAVRVAERIRKIIDEMSFIYADKTFKLTASIGVYCVKDFSLTIDQWISAAQELMYLAHQEGGNRIKE